MRDPYDVLGVSRKATDAEIKKAFRALAKKHHPDARGNDPKAVKRFQEISGAYELLGDNEQKGNLALTIPNPHHPDIGPKLLSDYVASDTGAKLRECLFSPMFFNSIARSGTLKSKN